MGKAAKIPCVYCDGRLEPGLPFCSSCEQPTMWATNEQRTAWELRQWRMKRATAAPAHVSARVDAIVAAAATQGEPVFEAPVRERMVSRPTFAPHPNGVWGSGRTPRAPQPWPPKPNDAPSNGNGAHLHLTGIDGAEVSEAGLDEDPPTQEVPPFILEVQFETHDGESATLEDDASEASLPTEPQPSEDPEAIDDDPEWAPAQPPLVDETPEIAMTDVEPRPYLDALPQPDLDPIPQRIPEPEQEAPREAAREETELVRELLRRVEEIEKKLDQPRRTGVLKRLRDLLVVDDPA